MTDNRLSSMLRNPEILLGAIVGGILVGIGWAVGSNLANNLLNKYGPSWLRAPPPPHNF